MLPVLCWTGELRDALAHARCAPSPCSCAVLCRQFGERVALLPRRRRVRREEGPVSCNSYLVRTAGEDNRERARRASGPVRRRERRGRTTRRTAEQARRASGAVPRRARARVPGQRVNGTATRDDAVLPRGRGGGDDDEGNGKASPKDERRSPPEALQSGPPAGGRSRCLADRRPQRLQVRLNNGGRATEGDRSSSRRKSFSNDKQSEV